MTGHKENKKLRDATTRAVALAMQAAWNDFCADTGNYPDCFEKRGGKLYADFEVGNFAEMVAGYLKAGVILARP